MKGDFRSRTFALLTKHGKEQIVAPILLEGLGAHLKHTSAFDTDELGTFAGEIPRILTPQEAARKKAELACELTGCEFGLGSEGSFDTGPFGLGCFDYELLTCVCPAEGWVVTATALGPSAAREKSCQNWLDVERYLEAVPKGQGLILRSGGNLFKGLTTLEEVRLLGRDLPFPFILSYDLRAHQCPERRAQIANAARNLVERLLASCPQCRTPGFWPDRADAGLPCSGCHGPTNALRQRRAVCARCEYEQGYPSQSALADPALCPSCNP